MMSQYHGFQSFPCNRALKISRHRYGTKLGHWLSPCVYWKHFWSAGAFISCCGCLWHGSKVRIWHSAIPLSRLFTSQYKMVVARGGPRPHNFKLTTKNRSITECDFITKMLFKDVYWHYACYIAILCIYISFLHVSSFIHCYFITCLTSCK